MSERAPEPEARGGDYEPPLPHVTATAVLSTWVGVLCLPMLRGRFIAAYYNDQYSTGYAFRAWAAAQWKALGEFPLWNPEIYGGMPFVAGMHGDLFYPTAWLRLLLPTHVAMNLGFAVHYVLAGVFTYWFLRTIKVSWVGAVLGGVAYQLSGVIGSYVSPGHDGKLFVTAVLPLGLVGLTWAVRDRRWEGYAVFALSVGLALLSPHPQMAQYFLVAAGLYTLYLVFEARREAPLSRRAVALVPALLAVVVGVGISAIQYLPFYAYIPFSPRDGSVLRDFAFSASYAIPWQHVPELVLSRFAGESFNGTYWAANGVKLHSEYLGLPVVALAVLGALHPDRRRMIWWLGGIGALLLLVALGSATPFYRLWWSVVPFVKSTRAPGMALFVVAFVVSVFAAFGVERVQGRAGRTHVLPWMVIAGVVVVLGLVGAFGAAAESLAQGIQTATGLPKVQAAVAAASGIRWGALASGVALAAAGGVVWGFLGGRVSSAVLAWGLLGVVGADLWWNARAFWNYSDVQHELFAPDEIKTFLQRQPRPFRVWNVGVYPQSSLMADGIAQWYGHHGNELHTFDVLNGREGVALTFRHEGHPTLRDLYAIEYIIVPTEAAPDTVPGFARVLDGVATSSGRRATLFRVTEPARYARLVPAALKTALDTTVATVLSPGFLDNVGRVVLLDRAAPVDPGPLTNPLPDPIGAAVEVVEWHPGMMRLEIRGGAPRDGYVLVGENHYKDWRAVVDGAEAPVVRGDGALITVPVAAGSRELTLTFVSREYALGRLLTLLSLGVVAVGVGAPPLFRRRKGA